MRIIAVITCCWSIIHPSPSRLQSGVLRSFEVQVVHKISSTAKGEFMTVYIVPSPFGLGFYITSDLEKARIQRDEWAVKVLDDGELYPPSEGQIDLSDDDAVDLDIEDAKTRVRIRTLDSETISRKSREKFLEKLNGASEFFGDQKELREIRKSFEI